MMLALVLLLVASTASALEYPAGWGQPGDVAVSGDFDGDGLQDPAVYRPSTGQWWILRSKDGTTCVATWGGQQGEVLVPGHWLSTTGALDLGVYRPSTGQWFVRASPC